ncbi:MAG TPA: aminoglycoside adenylyltransferase domain-containing protein [Candidatus Limnocylindrales bacterium]
MRSAGGPTRFAELNGVLDTFVDRARATLGEGLDGLYLLGSFAMGEGDEHSDVDFMAIVRRDLEGEALARVQAMHGEIHDLPSEWARHLDGSYAPADLWRRPPAQGRPPGDDRRPDWVDPGTGRGIGTYPFLYLDNGARSVVRSDHDNSLVQRWVAYHHGIALVGPPAPSLLDPIDDRALRAEVGATIVEWGGQLLAGPSWLSNLWRQPYVVISFCRMRQTLETGRIGSKSEGARWGMARLDPRWRPLIEAALAERPDPSLKVRLPADPAMVSLTLEFIREAIADVLRGGANVRSRDEGTRPVR